MEETPEPRPEADEEAEEAAVEEEASDPAAAREVEVWKSATLRTMTTMQVRMTASDAVRALRTVIEGLQFCR